MAPGAAGLSENSRRIAKNTLLLYFRMLLLIFIGLFTSRVVLDALGVEDYGVYNAVGGAVALFTFISASISSAISRFISFELGRGDEEKLRRVFCAGLLIQLLLSAVIVLLAETLGAWFLRERMAIPPGRGREVPAAIDGICRAHDESHRKHQDGISLKFIEHRDIQQHGHRQKRAQDAQFGRGSGGLFFHFTRLLLVQENPKKKALWFDFTLPQSLQNSY